MEFNFSLSRILLLVVLVAIFAMLGGFAPPSFPQDSMIDSHRVMKAWRYCVLLFLAGAVSVSIVDHFVGTVDRTNIRLLYIIIGVIFMGVSYTWLRSLREPANNQPMKVSHNAAGNERSSFVNSVLQLRKT